jgi:N-acetylmuramoyl-L-alanine amidase
MMSYVSGGSGGASGGGSSGGGSSGGGGSYTSEADVMLLARVINGEARGEPYIGQVAVAAVILNRVETSGFPNTLSGVIYQPGAFDAVADGQVNLQPKESCIKAARDAINGWDPTGGAIYYYNPKTATNQWIRSRPIVYTVGNHVFCK